MSTLLAIIVLALLVVIALFYMTFVMGAWKSVLDFLDAIKRRRAGDPWKEKESDRYSFLTRQLQHMRDIEDAKEKKSDVTTDKM